jgi:hypothetical protein
MGQPRTVSKELPLPTESTDVQADAPSIAQEPWRSWGTTVRYSIIRLTQTAPLAALAYFGRAHHTSLLHAGILIYPILPTYAGSLAGKLTVRRGLKLHRLRYEGREPEGP